MRLPAWLMLAAVVLPVACDPDSGENGTGEFPFAVAHRDCAPWDGAAVRVIMAKQPLTIDSLGGYQGSRPTLEFAAYSGLNDAIGKRFDIKTNGVGSSGYASWCTSESACTGATDGWIRFASQRGDSVFGSYDVSFPDGSKYNGGFAALWRPVVFLCG